MIPQIRLGEASFHTEPIFMFKELHTQTSYFEYQKMIERTKPVTNSAAERLNTDDWYKQEVLFTNRQP